MTETPYYTTDISTLTETPDLTTIGGRIKHYRLLNSLLQRQLSSLAGISSNTLLQYENNQIPHSLETCTKIADALKIDPFLIYDDYLKFIADDFAKTIRLARQSNNLTQGELGQAIGIHKKVIQRWENKRDRPSRKSYEILNDLLFSELG